MTSIRLALVDDHKMLLGALTEWIRSAADDIDMVAAVSTWPELLTSPEFPVDVVLLDVDLKDNIPISLKISTLKTTGVKVVLMSTYSEPNIVREALAAGALGYLVKSEPVEMIIEAIRAAAQGESFISAELDLALNAGDIGGAPKLSAQERRVMALYGGGEPVKSVAYELGISEETAKSYLKRIREKYRVAGIDVGTKVALRKRAIKDGILIQDSPQGSFEVCCAPPLLRRATHRSGSRRYRRCPA
ncbi:response regulator transcription factor [soil metagenome]